VHGRRPAAIAADSAAAMTAAVKTEEPVTAAALAVAAVLVVLVVAAVLVVLVVAAEPEPAVSAPARSELARYEHVRWRWNCRIRHRIRVPCALRSSAPPFAAGTRGASKKKKKKTKTKKKKTKKKKKKKKSREIWGADQQVWGDTANSIDRCPQTPSMDSFSNFQKKRPKKAGSKHLHIKKKSKIQREKKKSTGQGWDYFFFFCFFVFLTVFHMASRAIRASALSRPPSLGAVPEEDGSSSDDGSGADSLSAGSSRSNDNSNGDSGSDDDTTTKFGPATLAKQDSAIPHAFWVLSIFFLAFHVIHCDWLYSFLFNRCRPMNDEFLGGTRNKKTKKKRGGKKNRLCMKLTNAAMSFLYVAPRMR
jgi:hypothetical protein